MSDNFPCRYECAHVDCVEERGRPSRCVVCKEPVQDDDLYVVSRGDYTYASHRACTEKEAPAEQTV